jgi:hypothetical protein
VKYPLFIKAKDMTKVTVNIQVLQSDGITPASFAVVQVYKYVCVWFLCWDSFTQQIMTDFYGRTSLLLDEATWRLRGSCRGKEGNARFTLTSKGVGTITQWGELIVTLKKAA